MGAWIEMYSISFEVILIGSLLSWERGLKCLRFMFTVVMALVAPLVGAWIEIVGRTLNLWLSMSLLSWERGLKSVLVLIPCTFCGSLLSWERGLKYLNRL